MILNDKNQRCTLVSYEYEQDSSGFAPDRPGAIRQEVWCKVSSITGAEFARMGQNSIKPSLRVTLWANEYAGQDVVVIDGLPYGVYRTYQPGMDEIELYLERKAGVKVGED